MLLSTHGPEQGPEQADRPPTCVSMNSPRRPCASSITDPTYSLGQIISTLEE